MSEWETFSGLGPLDELVIILNYLSPHLAELVVTALFTTNLKSSTAKLILVRCVLPFSLEML